MTRIIAILFAVLLALPVRAEIPLPGTFTASEACPAYQSISRRTNPGNVRLRPGAAYEQVAVNRNPPSHFWIRIPGAQPERRWVARDCGTSSASLAAPETAVTKPVYRGTQYILAVNWQPAFCETAPHTRECRDQAQNGFEASHFTLHGLWPQPRGNEYCAVSQRDLWSSRDGRWRDLPPLDLTIAQRRDLDRVMPGSLSGLDRHEWIKHGTCYGTGQRDYYADALDMMLALNTSPVAELFAANIGRKLTLSQIRAAFDRSFGAGAGERVAMTCARDGNRILITELQIGLTGEIEGPDDFPALVAAAAPIDTSCRSGQVDAVGLR
jgi:ribonuclease T2